MTRSPAGARSCGGPGAIPVVADALDAGALLAGARRAARRRRDPPTDRAERHAAHPARHVGHQHAAHPRHRQPARRRPRRRCPPVCHPVDRARLRVPRPRRADAHRGGPVRCAGARAARAVVEALADNERQVFEADGIEGVALRYGLFYGPGTTDLAGMLRRRMFPVPVRRWRGDVVDLPRGRRRRDRGRAAPGAAPARRTTSSTTSRCGGASSWTRPRRPSACRARRACRPGCCARCRTATPR